MTSKKKYSPFIRSVCGVLGMVGIAAIGVNALREGSIHFSLLLLAQLFAGFIFLYVAFFGTSPLEFSERDDGGS